eukprot:13721601-Ditylum_brightwellii.AAC.1
MCEGPSMMPTIQPKGEIILLEKFTHRLKGLDGGDVLASERRLKHLSLQREWMSQQKKKKQRGEEEHEESIIPTWYQPKLKSVQDLQSSPSSSSSPENKYKTTLYNRLYERCTTGVKVGDVVVVQHPNRDGTVCKRVLGLPGDIVIQQQEQQYFHHSKQYDLLREYHAAMNRDNDHDHDECDDSHYRQRFKYEYTKLLVKKHGHVIPDGHVWLE